MLFNSLEYALFLPLVVGLYWALRWRAQNALLLAVSYLFYGWWDPRFLVLIGFSTVVAYTTARAMEGGSGRRRRGLMLTSVVANLAVLGFFKYWGFFTDSAGALLEQVGLEAHLPVLQVVLPVGISFYTFQTLSYTVDVYRGRVEACRSLLTFGVYVAYFPQLVAGPIERATNLLPQFSRERRRPGTDVTGDAFLLIVRGLFKKVALADTVAPVVDAIYQDASSAGAVALVVAAVGFGVQIYGDFSGYTDIARGSSRLLGIDLVENFRQPYLSRNITEFWRRWHVSLSNWLRDYLYVPLGGNRRGPRRTYVNLLLTMLLGGLWHGAAWTFVAWGAFHGAALGIHRAVRPDAAAGWKRPWRASDLPTTAATFVLVNLGWVLFRADSFAQASDVLRGILTLRPGPVSVDQLAVVALALAAMVALDVSERVELRRRVLARLPVLAGAPYGLMVGGVLVASGHASVPFIYFQF